MHVTSISGVSHLQNFNFPLLIAVTLLLLLHLICLFGNKTVYYFKRAIPYQVKQKDYETFLGYLQPVMYLELLLKQLPVH